MKTIAEMRAYRPHIPDDYWENEADYENVPEDDRDPYYDAGIRDVVSILFESTLSDVLFIGMKKTATGYQVMVYSPEYPEQEYAGFKTEYATIPTQGEIFDVFADMKDEGIEGRLWVTWMEDYKTLKEVTDFISMESAFYPDLNALLIDFYQRHGFK